QRRNPFRQLALLIERRHEAAKALEVLHRSHRAARSSEQNPLTGYFEAFGVVRLPRVGRIGLRTLDFTPGYGQQGTIAVRFERGYTVHGRRKKLLRLRLRLGRGRTIAVQ